MLIMAIAAAGYSAFSFCVAAYGAMQARKMQSDLESRLGALGPQQGFPNGDAGGVRMVSGMLGGMDTMATTAILLVKFAALVAEKTAYQYLCLAMAIRSRVTGSADVRHQLPDKLESFLHKRGIERCNLPAT
jgi:hypothetical protein